MLDLVWLIPALPLAGFVFLLVAGRRLGEPLAGWVATLACGGAFVASCIVFAGLVAEDHQHREHVVTLFEWLPAGGFSLAIGLLSHQLSITKPLLVPPLGTMHPLYSIRPLNEA